VDPEDTNFFSAGRSRRPKTLMFGIEGNEAGKEIKNKEEHLSKFDEVITFTTDTHRSIHDFSRKKTGRNSKS